MPTTPLNTEDIVPVKTRTLANFCQLLVNFLPIGRLWDPINTTLKLLLEAFAEEFDRNDQRNIDLQRELIPGESVELLVDWERVALAPDELIVGGGTIAERQARVSTKIFDTQDPPTKQFFEVLALARGVVIAISFTSGGFRVGVSRVGQRLHGSSSVFIWIVDYVSGDKNEYARLEATFRRLKHAYQFLQFNAAPP